MVLKVFSHQNISMILLLPFSSSWKKVFDVLSIVFEYILSKLFFFLKKNQFSKRTN